MDLFNRKRLTTLTKGLARSQRIIDEMAKEKLELIEETISLRSELDKAHESEAIFRKMAIDRAKELYDLRAKYNKLLNDGVKDA